LDMVALAQPVLADEGDRQVYVVRAEPVPAGADEGTGIADVEDARNLGQRAVAGLGCARRGRALRCDGCPKGVPYLRWRNFWVRQNFRPHRRGEMALASGTRGDYYPQKGPERVGSGSTLAPGLPGSCGAVRKRSAGETCQPARGAELAAII